MNAIESSPVVGLMAMPKSSNRLRELVSPQLLPCVHSSPRWIVPVTARKVKLRPLFVERSTSTTQLAEPSPLGLPMALESLLLPARFVPYHAMSTRPALPPATVG